MQNLKRTRMITVKDNFLSSEEHETVLQYCLSSMYTYGETDTETTPPTGMIHEIEEKEICELLKSKTQTLAGDLNLERVYINCFSSSENPYFHTDGLEGITFLYYPQKNWHINDGGTTEFFLEKQILGIPPIPNRIVYFDANIEHRATPFRDRHRFTVAIKYK